MLLQDDFDDMRRFAYDDCDVIMACFSVVHPTSLHNIADKWLEEIGSRLRGIPVVLVGTQSDLRDDLDVLVDLATYKFVFGLHSFLWTNEKYKFLLIF